MAGGSGLEISLGVARNRSGEVGVPAGGLVVTIVLVGGCTHKCR
jgi:hypothetical protein